MTVYVADPVLSVGVPVIAPVEVLKIRPVGKEGLTLKAVTIPVTVGSCSVIVTPTGNENGEL